MFQRLNFRSLITTAAVVATAAVATTATMRHLAPQDTGVDAQQRAAAKIIRPAPSPTLAVSSGSRVAGTAAETVELVDLPQTFTFPEIERARASRNNSSSNWAAVWQRASNARRFGSGNGGAGFAGISGFSGGTGQFLPASRGTPSTSNAGGSSAPTGGNGGGGGASGGPGGPAADPSPAAPEPVVPPEGIFAEHITPVDELTSDGVVQLEAAAIGGAASLDADVSGLSATPEPGSLLLIGTGLVGILGALRRRLT